MAGDASAGERGLRMGHSRQLGRPGLAATPVAFFLLGQLRVGLSHDVEIPGSRMKQVLAALLVHRNEFVSTRRLSRLVWDEPLPESAAANMRLYASRLRRILAAHALAEIADGTRGGYQLRVEPARIDVDVFVAKADSARLLISSGDLRAGVDGIRSALSLWRSTPLEGLDCSGALQSVMASFESIRLACIQDEAAARLALGQHDRVVAQLCPVVGEHPLHEGIWAQLILARYRAGDVGAALDGCRRLRQALAVHLAVKPGEVIVRLESYIIRRDPVLMERSFRITTPTMTSVRTAP